MLGYRIYIRYYRNGLFYVRKEKVTSFKVLKYWRYETRLKGFSKIVEKLRRVPIFKKR